MKNETNYDKVLLHNTEGKPYVKTIIYSLYVEYIIFLLSDISLSIRQYSPIVQMNEDELPFTNPPNPSLASE